MKDIQKNIIPHDFAVTKAERNAKNNHPSFLIWFTGLSGSGKSTIANQVEIALHNMEIKTYLLDGDNVRKGLNNDLTFTEADRNENIRRIGEVANLMIDAGLVVLASFVSPYKIDREKVKNIVKDTNFVEVFVDTPVEVCAQRDVKGLYAKAMRGEIKNFTGVSAPYEQPENPALQIKTVDVTVQEAVALVIEKIKLKLEG